MTARNYPARETTPYTTPCLHDKYPGNHLTTHQTRARNYLWTGRAIRCRQASRWLRK